MYLPTESSLTCNILPDPEWKCREMLIREGHEDPSLDYEIAKLIPEQGWEITFIEHLLVSASVL